jgi:hypothetical protein
MPYQVRDWNDHFENNKSRERDRCSFVCIPNKQHGLGFSRVMAEPDGMAIYGVWVCILEACSQQLAKNGRRREGWLTADGHSAGTPWAAQDLALKFHRPIKEIDRCLEVVCGEKVAWMVWHECPPTTRPMPVRCPPSAFERNGTETKELKEEKRTETKTVAPAVLAVADGIPSLLAAAEKLFKPSVWCQERKVFEKHAQLDPVKFKRVTAEIMAAIGEGRKIDNRAAYWVAAWNREGAKTANLPS